MAKYNTRYKKENYSKLWARKDVAKRFKEYASSRGLTETEALRRLLDIGTQYDGAGLRDAIAAELLDYAGQALGPSSKEKLLRFMGGDWHIKDEIIGLLARSRCSTLVEVFGGSGVVSMHAPRSVFKNIVYNDKDDLLYAFFKVLRERPDELMKALILMPASRRLNAELTKLAEEGQAGRLGDVEKAALVFCLSRTSFDGMPGAGFGLKKVYSLQQEYVRKVLAIADAAKRWLDVTIENKDFREVIRLYDSDSTVFYCDPPCVAAEPGDYYRLSFTHADMHDLLALLSGIKGKFVLKLSDKHLQHDYIRSFAERYSVKAVEHTKYSQKPDGGLPKQRTLLIYNYRFWF